jgi:hypothetical protein
MVSGGGDCGSIELGSASADHDRQFYLVPKSVKNSKMQLMQLDCKFLAKCPD